MLFIRNFIKICADILNRNIFRTSALIRRLTRNRINLKFYADMVTMALNRAINNEFIPNPKEHLYIEVSNICNLRCRFCAYSKSLNNKKEIMSNETFFSIVDRATNFGYFSFGLTPIVGEVFVDPNFIEKIIYLENHPKVEHYSFFSNFTLVTEQIIDDLLKTKKIKELYISLYGHDLDSFIEITGSNQKSYKKLILNLNYLYSRAKDIRFKINFGLRTSRSFESLEKCGSELCQIVKAIISKIKSKITILKSFNTWGGFITQEDVKGLDMIINDISDYHKNGACSLIFYKNQVMVDGIVNACACRDINATLKIGDLNKQEFNEIYSKNNKDYMYIIETQQRGKFNPICKNCDFYRSIYKNYDVYHKYKKKSISIKRLYH